MPKQLVPLSVASPGFYGLNKQLGGSVLPPGWASEASNLIFDETSRLASRKGYKNKFSSNPTGTPRVIHEYIDGDGNRATLFATNNTIIEDDEDGTNTDRSGTATLGGDDWQFVNFNGNCVGFRDGDAPIVATSVGGNFADIVLAGTQQPTTAADNVLAAFGRLWTIDGTNLKYSDLLDHTAWNGIFDLSIYWKNGADEGTAIAEYNGYLVIFGSDNIIIYANPQNPTGTVGGIDNTAGVMQIVENIGGIGCVARDSIQDVGTDLVFLSRTGVRSLGRTIQEKSNPVRDISKNIKDYLISIYSDETEAIKSVYNSEEGFYALSFPSQSKTFVFDLKTPNQDGTPKITEWEIGPSAFEYTLTSEMYMAFTTKVAYYTGYNDDVNYDDTGGSSYNLEWVGSWNDFGQEVASLVKIPKKISVLMGGVAGRTVTVKWAYDYIDSFSTANITFPTGSVALYGVATYTNNIYSGLLSFNTAKTPLQSSGQVMKFGIESPVNGDKIILQRLDILAKTGRYAI